MTKPKYWVSFADWMLMSPTTWDAIEKLCRQSNQELCIDLRDSNDVQDSYDRERAEMNMTPSEQQAWHNPTQRG